MRPVLRTLLLVLLGATAPLARSAPASSGDPEGSRDRLRLEAVRTFAENVLAHGRDRYGLEHTPLFADGVDVETREAVRWRYEGKEWILSNQASQQNLFRTLVGLSRLLDDPRYERAAKQAIAHMFERQRAPCGLLYWGGHRFVDLATEVSLREHGDDVHEFKWNFPFYGLMAEVDAEKTAQFVRAYWNAHILDWSRLDMSRHGRFARPLGRLWENEFSPPPPFFEGRGLTFINAGSDLIYAAGELFALTGERGALQWGLRLARLYVDARHPETGLGVYQYSQPTRETTPPSDSADPEFTFARFGDRAQRQFGPEFGAIALEGNLLENDRGIYSRNAYMQLQLAERLGDEGRDLLEWTCAGLRAYARHAYIPERNALRPIWTDGTDLTGFVFPRDGYFGPAGRVFRESPAGALLLLSYALASRLTGDPELWTVTRQMARGHGLGDLGVRPGEGVAVNLGTTCAEPAAVFAVLELFRATRNDANLDLARRLGDNLVARRFHHGFFLPGERHRHARFDAEEPLALLAIEAALRGRPQDVPAYTGGRGYFHGRYDGLGRTYDQEAIWSVQR